jgi:hypothetical protein
MPNAGSGSSGGTSSAGKLTSHNPPGYPYRQRFSFSDVQHVKQNTSTKIHNARKKKRRKYA